MLRQASCAPRRAPQQHRVLFTNAPSKICLFPSSSSPAETVVENSRAAKLRGRDSFLTMATVTQSRAHSGHAHGHTHDKTFLTSTNKSDAGVRVTRLGLYVNVAMALSKGIGGYYLNSQALMADGVHAVSDMVSDLLTLLTVSYALLPPNERFPNGYGRVESLGALGVSVLLAGGGAMLGLHSLELLYMQFFPDLAHYVPALVNMLSGHGHGMLGHSHSHAIPNLWAGWLAAASIVIKEWLYRRSKFSLMMFAFQHIAANDTLHIAMKVAKERQSSVLASNAVHHRVDCFTSIVALVAIGGANILTNAAWLDPVGSLLVSGMIVRAGSQNTWSAIKELLDKGLEDTVKQSIRKAATTALAEGSLEDTAGRISNTSDVTVREVQGTKAGQNYLVEVVLATPGSYSTFQTRQIEHVVRQRVGAEVRGVRKVRVKFIPKEEEAEASFMDDFVGVEDATKVTAKVDDVHDHDYAGDGHANGSKENGNTKAREGH